MGYTDNCLEILNVDKMPLEELLQGGQLICGNKIFQIIKDIYSIIIYEKIRIN